MALIAGNQEQFDCVIVAFANLLEMAGRPGTYAALREYCIDKGWYDPKAGFYNNFIDQLIEDMNVPIRMVPNGTPLALVESNIKKGKPHIILYMPTDGTNGHACTAVKSGWIFKKVKIINGLAITTWKELDKASADKKIGIGAWELVA